MNHAPAITVVVPTQDRGPLLAEALESVRVQSFADWECIVVDDGSTDDTPERVRALAARDDRFRYVRQAPSSAAAARNRGLALARGRYTAFLDSDDLFEPDRLVWQHAALEADPGAVLVYGDTFQFRGGDPRTGSVYLADWPRPAGEAFEALLTCSALYAPLVRTDALRALGGFDTTLASAEDWDAWLGLARRGRVLHEPRIALRYRLHAGNKSARTLRNLDCARRTARKHLRAVPLHRRPAVALGVRRYFARVYGPRLEREAFAATAAGDWNQARASWRALARLDPVRAASSRSALVHVAWAALPTSAAPPWDRSRRATCPEPTTAPTASTEEAATATPDPDAGAAPAAAPGRWRRLLPGAPRLLADLLHPGKPRHRALARLGSLRTRLAWRARRLVGSRRPTVAIALVDHLGDIVAAEPLLREVRRRHPEARLVWIARRPWRALLEAHPAIDEVIPVRCLTEWIHLRDARLFDRVYDLHVEGRACDTCYWPLERLELRTGITLQNYYRHGGLLEIFCRLAGLPPLDESPRLAPPPEVAARIDALNLPARFVAIHAEARQAARNWRDEGWAALVEHVTSREDLEVVELGMTPGEQSRDPRHRDLCGRLDPLESAEVLRRATLFIGVDSGPAHMAHAVGTPGVVLLGRYCGCERYMPYSGAYRDGSLAEVIQAEGPASSIEVERVLAAAERFLRPAPREEPTVSVVVPTYRHRDLIGTTLESVFAQTQPPLEVLVVDDGSPDDTRAVLEPWIASGRVRYLHQENRGQGAARNLGLLAARGTYVAFLDDDDLWPADALERRLEALERHPRALLAYGAHTTSWPDGRRLAHDQSGFPEGWCADAFLDRNWIHSPGQTLIRRDALERLGGFDQDLAGSDDWDLYLRLARLGPFVRVPGEALIYREHGANASRDAVAHARDHLRVMSKHMRGRPLLVLRHLRLAAAYFVPNLDRLAAVCRGEGRYGEALRANLYALLFRPTLLARPRFLASCAASLLGVPSRRRAT